MNFDQLYPGRFIKAGTIGDKRVTVTIDRVFHENLEGNNGPEQKVIMTFAGKTMGLVLAKINGACCAAMFGSDARGWIGKRIVLYSTNKIMPFPRARGDRRPPDQCLRIYGSPDISEKVEVIFKKRKGCVKMTMQPTGGASRRGIQPATDKAPPHDATTGEIKEPAAEGPELDDNGDEIGIPKGQ